MNEPAAEALYAMLNGVRTEKSTIAVELGELEPPSVEQFMRSLTKLRVSERIPDTLVFLSTAKSLVRGIAVEINSAYIHNLPLFLEPFAEINPYVSIGSDMHVLENLGHCRDQLLKFGIGGQP